MREAISSPSRRTPLAETGSELDSHAQDNAVVIRLLAPRARFSLRIDLSLLARAKTIAGFALGMPINRYTTAAGWTAMRLGPDEWLLSGPESEAARIAGDVEAALASLHHALVDVGHARCLEDVRPDLAQVDPLRGRLQQDVEHVAEQSPRPGQHQQGDADRGDHVRP